MLTKIHPNSTWTGASWKIMSQRRETRSVQKDRAGNNSLPFPSSHMQMVVRKYLIIFSFFFVLFSAVIVGSSVLVGTTSAQSVSQPVQVYSLHNVLPLIEKRNGKPLYLSAYDTLVRVRYSPN